MKWLLISIIVCLSFYKALTVRCYECYGDCETNTMNTTSCSDGCYSAYSVSYENVVIDHSKSKGCSESGMMCGELSQNLGYAKMIFSNKCCSSELCNSGPFPAIDLNPNGKQCYFCLGDNCLGTVRCEGIEDHCFTYTEFQSEKNQTFKGCASKSLCDPFPSSLRLTGMKITEPDVSIKCCKGNLCNSAESVTLSFLLMMFFLLSSFFLF